MQHLFSMHVTESPHLVLFGPQHHGPPIFGNVCRPPAEAVLVIGVYTFNIMLLPIMIAS